MDITNKTTWHKVYKELATTLALFHKKFGEESGKMLFTLCKGDSEFLAENGWIEKFESTWEVSSLDPMHVFASTAGNTTKSGKRVKRINILLRVLGKVMSNTLGFKPLTDIDFSGCPAPMTAQLLNARDEIDQNEIWEVFYKVCKNGQEGIDADLFDRVKIWSGIGRNSLTLLLFWLDSENFMPLDKFTIELLRQYKKLTKEPKTAKDYLSLLEFKNTSLYRAISLFAYSKEEFKQLPEEDQRIFYNYLNSKDESVIKKRNFASGKCRLIAIKPLEDCNSKHRKALKVDTLYKIYQSFNVIGDQLEFDSNQDHNIYSQDLNFNLSISAIVGKNGTGKSTIIELFFTALNNIAYLKFNNRNSSEKLIWVNKINLEFYFETDSIYRVSLLEDNIQITKFDSHPTIKQRYIVDWERSLKKFEMEEFFYTVNVNYSLHGLNSLHYGKWLKSLFHKNDSYQAPLVIEPYRDKGNIDINKQESLVKQRLLANLLEIDNPDKDPNFSGNSLRELKQGMKAITIELTLNKDKLSDIWEEKPNKGYADIIYEGEWLLEAILNEFGLENKIDPTISNTTKDSVQIDDIAKLYILKKTADICVAYPLYRQYFDSNERRFHKKEVHELAYNLSQDFSHRTFKLRQALNFLHSGLYSHEHKQKVDIDNMSIEIAKTIDKLDKHRVDFFIPPPFFEVTVHLDNSIELSSLSSGEKQKIYSINSIVYHIKNIDSVESDDNSQTQYKYINISLDEIELCFHPEMQRRYIQDLIQALRGLNLERILGINLCFITHSPFVLSDIPHMNILFLNSHEESPSNPKPVNENTKTFAANIHDLLAKGFFLKNSIGAFSESQIREIVELYGEASKGENFELNKENYSKNRSKYLFIQRSIADDFISGVVSNHLKFLEQEFGFNDPIQVEISNLELKLAELKARASINA